MKHTTNSSSSSGSYRRRLTLAATIGIASALLGAAAGCGNRGGEQAKASPAPGAPGAAAAQQVSASPVRVGTSQERSVERAISVTGSVQALKTVNLAPKLSARVVSIAGREGNTVSAGQVVVQQETADLKRQVEQARANLQAAQARVAQAETTARLQVTQNDTGVRNAEEQLRSARAQLALAKKPQRTQEVAVAENNVAQAQANYDRARVDRDRYATLVKEGAVAQSVYDQYATQEQVARAALDSAKQQLAIAREGGRAETVRQSESAVAQAEQQVRLARANRQQVDVRQDEVKAARAAVAQARAALGVAQQALSDASVRSPIDGVIADRMTEPGQLASPGSPVLQIVDLSTVYFEAQVAETDLAAVRPGQPVSVRIAAFPGRTFAGRVQRIYPTGSTQSRTFVARIVVPNSGSALKPGLFARGSVVAEKRESVVVPRDAVLLTLDGDQDPNAPQTGRVFVVDDGVARERKVTLGLSTPDGLSVEVSGVEPGRQVVVSGQRALKDGDPVTVQQNSATQTAALR
ncbi:MAG TPA: efflux RND transporter periplasmic adaptor subunit [Armatimonadaceae bacterium]|nr:efflux RND transporter periplasmic adaptor subunit [Armatimonadaceae bacterium]